MLNLLTSGESHGIGLTAILDGMPANVPVSVEEINKELARRQQGYGRGARQQIEKDTVNMLSGIRHGKTMGSPITLFIENKDHKNWQKIMAVSPIKDKIESVTQLRPGHADFAGLNKYNQRDIRNILERSSARTTASTVAAGSVCKQFLNQFKIKVSSVIITIDSVTVNDTELNPEAKDRIDQAREAGDSLGGIVELRVTNVPVGLGSHVQSARKLDGRLAGALMSLQSVKGVEFGLGFEAARLPGHKVHDELFINKGEIYRKTNNAGGIEGGMSNGEDIVMRIALKPIPTMTKPLHTVDWAKKKEALAHVERADVCAVESAGVIAESIVAYEIANSFLEKFGGDSLEETIRHFKA